MKRRSRAREVAVQMLYVKDLNPSTEATRLHEKVTSELSDTELRDFAWLLVSGVLEQQQELDHQIQEVAQNWTLNRMAPTDRNVLRLGAYELLYTGMHFRIVIDEAVELARRFGSKNSGPFVNGILDKLIPEKKRNEAVSEMATEADEPDQE